MKLHIPALVAVLAIALTGCGGGDKPSSSSTATTTPSASSPTRARVPDLKGKTVTEAVKALQDIGYSASIKGPDGKRWDTSTEPDETVVTVSTTPSAGAISDSQTISVSVNVNEWEFVAKAATKATAKELADTEANIATRYTYSCGGYGGRDYKNYKEVWGGGNYKDGGGPCTIKILGISPSNKDKSDLLPSEQKLVDAVAAKGVEIKKPGATLDRIMSLCAKLDNTWGATYMDKQTTPESRAEAAVALTVCPDAPHAAELQSTVNTPRVVDGTMVVGQAMEPGTWKTKPGVKLCYWSRNTGGGDIIANDIVDFAPDGVTVTVNAGEGFKSSSCGTWSKIG